MGRIGKDELKSGRSAVLPCRTFGVGKRFMVRKRMYRVVPIGRVVKPCERCSGCAFAKRNCPENIACSSFDRSDGRNVWFVED